LALYYTFSTSKRSIISSGSFPDGRYDAGTDRDDGASDRPVRRPEATAIENLNLDESQCRETFPGLTYEIDRAVANGPFTLEKRTVKGPLVAAIRDTELWILEEPGKGELSRQMKEVRGQAMTSQPLAPVLDFIRNGQDPMIPIPSYSFPQTLY
jgi:hypothetical protein